MPNFIMNNQSYKKWVNACSWRVRTGIEFYDKLGGMVEALLDLDEEASQTVTGEALHFLRIGNHNQQEFAAWILQFLGPPSVATQVAEMLPFEGHAQIRICSYLRSVLSAAQVPSSVHEALADWDHAPHSSSLPEAGIWYHR